MEFDEKLLYFLIKEIKKYPKTRPHGETVSKFFSGQQHLRPYLYIEPEDQLLGQVYSSMAVLCRDMSQYFSKDPEKDVIGFNRFLSEINMEEKKIFSEGAFPIYANKPIEIFPTGITSSAEKGQISLVSLADPRLVHEWTFFPGVSIFQKFRKESKERMKLAICGKSKINDLFRKGEISPKEVLVTIGGLILSTYFSGELIWYPIAAHFSYIMVKKSLDKYCEES